MATKIEVRDRAANELGILQLGQALQSQDVTRITAAYDEVYADLKAEGLATWTSTAAVPAAVVPHMAILIAHNCSETYGISPERKGRIDGKAGVAKREIRKIVTPRYESMEEPRDY